MAYVITAPEMMAAAATDLATIGSTLSVAHTLAATPTLALMSAAADEVSASIAHLFSRHAQDYQALAGRAAAFHEQFVQHLNASADSYAATEAANASSLPALNASANAGLQDQLRDLLTSANAIWGQLHNSLTSFWNEFSMVLFGTAVGLSFIAILLTFVVLFTLLDPRFFTDYFIPSLF